MKAKLHGVVMEFKDELDEKDRLLATKTMMLFQRGEKKLLGVKRVPDGFFSEGEYIEDLLVKVFPWTMNGAVDVSFSYIGADAI